MNPFYEYPQCAISGRQQPQQQQSYLTSAANYKTCQPQVSVQPAELERVPQQAQADTGNGRLLRPRYMSHSRSRSDPNFMTDQRNGQSQQSVSSPQEFGRLTNHCHQRSPSDPSLNLTKEAEPTSTQLVDIESDEGLAPHWNPFSPFYETKERDFVANPGEASDEDFASLRETSNFPMSHAEGKVSQLERNVSNMPTAEFHPRSDTDAFGAAMFSGTTSEFQQSRYNAQQSSSEQSGVSGSCAQLRDDGSLDVSRAAASDILESNNPFMQDYRVTEIEQHLKSANLSSSDSETEISNPSNQYHLRQPTSPGLSDPFGAAPFVVQKPEQVEPTAPASPDVFGSAPFTLPVLPRPRGSEKQAGASSAKTQPAKLATGPFDSAGGMLGGTVSSESGTLGATPFEQCENSIDHSALFLENSRDHYKVEGSAFDGHAGLVNPGVDFKDNPDDPFGGVSFSANAALKETQLARRNAKKQQMPAPVAAESRDRPSRSRPRRRLPQTPNATSIVDHSGRPLRAVSDQGNAKVVLVDGTGVSSEASRKFAQKPT